ncbi:zinc finger protein 346 [Nematostella vectensis]|uniref:zinc finger protein 346 n=1 Tax=Nematostella vectensis TaxID=45351 RepID=UPI0020777499|nr:zinc finger protein 346 [Nematostella vectensis]
MDATPEVSPQKTDTSPTSQSENPTKPIEQSPEPAVQVKKGTKRKAPSDNKLYICEICHVELNSASQAFQHFQGKAHLGKVRVLEQVSEVTQPPKPAKPFTPHLKPPKPKPGSHLDPDTHCPLCKKWFNSRVQADSHYSGKAHLTQVDLYNMQPKFKKTKEEEEFDKLLEEADAMTHQEVKNVKNIKLGKNVKTQLYTCEPCNITLNSQKQMSQHLLGLRHKIVVGKAQPPPPPTPGESATWEGHRYKKLATTLLTKASQQSPLTPSCQALSPGGTKMGQYYCQDCDISMNSIKQMEQHMTSARHRDGLKGGAKRKNNKNKGASVNKSLITQGKIPPLFSSFVKPDKPEPNTFLACANELPLNLQNTNTPGNNDSPVITKNSTPTMRFQGIMSSETTSTNDVQSNAPSFPGNQLNHQTCTLSYSSAGTISPGQTPCVSHGQWTPNNYMQIF